MASDVVVSSPRTDNDVTIFTTHVRENHVNSIQSFDIPKAPVNYDEGDEKLYFDFLMRTRVIEVIGFIAKEQGGSIATITLRTRLKDIFTKGGEVSIVYLGETITGPMTGLEFREIAEDEGTNTPRFFMVRFSITKATPIGT